MCPTTAHNKLRRFIEGRKDIEEVLSQDSRNFEAQGKWKRENSVAGLDFYMIRSKITVLIENDNFNLKRHENLYFILVDMI